MYSLRAHIDSILKVTPEKSESEIALLVLAEMDSDAIRNLALAYVRSIVWDQKRTRQLGIERRAERIILPPEKVEANKRRLEAADRERTRVKQAALDAKTAELAMKWGLPANSTRFDLVQHYKSYVLEHGWRSPDRRVMYKDLSETYSIVEIGLIDAQLAMDCHIEEQRLLAKLEVTQELLGSEFAVGDGRRVSWAEATVEDHTERAVMLSSNAAANAAAATRHRIAIDLIRKAGALNLGQISAQESSA